MHFPHVKSLHYYLIAVPKFIRIIHIFVQQNAFKSDSALVLLRQRKLHPHLKLILTKCLVFSLHAPLK